MSKKIKITKEWLEEQYLILNKTQEDIALFVGCSRKNISYYLKKYNIQKSSSLIEESKKRKYFQKHGFHHQSLNPKTQEKIRQTNLKKYGVPNPAQSSEIKDKIAKTNLERYGFETPLLNEKVKNKTRKTNIERYGSEHHLESQEIQKKIQEAFKRKYPDSHPMKSKEVKDKFINTSIERYGVANPAQNQKIILKIQKTNLERYGVSSTLQLERVRDSLRKSIQKKYGVNSLFGTKEFRNLLIEKNKISLVFGKTLLQWAKEYQVPHVTVYSLLKAQPNISYENFIKFLDSYEKNKTDIEQLVSLKLNLNKWDKQIDGLNYRPDFKLSETSYLNVDGLYWHSELNKDKNYHFNMRKEYEALGLRIFQFRADEIYHKLDIIYSMILNHQNKIEHKIGARKTQINTPKTDEAKVFLDKYHIKGYKACKHKGLYYNNKLISIMSFKIVGNILKIERFCSKTNFSVIGAFSKLLNGILKEIKKDVVIHYWVDLRYGTGSFLLNQNFKIEKETLGWEWTDGVQTFNRLKCRANMDQRKLPEKEYAEELGWYKIYDAGQRLYIREFKYEQK